MDWRLRDVNVGLRGGKTFCAIVCASFIAGSRRAFLFVDCVFFLCVVLWEFWLRLNEIHEVRTFSPCKAFLFEDSRTRPILSLLLTHPSSGSPVVQVVSRPSARSYSADVSRRRRILPNVRSGAAHCIKLLKNLSRFQCWIHFSEVEKNAHTLFQPLSIGHFRVPPGLCFKTRVGAQPLIWKSFFILMQIKLIFTRKVVHLASFWK